VLIGERKRLMEMGYGTLEARDIIRGNELRQMVSEMIETRSWAVLGQILVRLIDTKFPRKLNDR
jgi:hypothetical protein